MASTLGNEFVSLEAPPTERRRTAPRHRAVRRHSTLTVVAWITVPRLAVAFVLSAVTERTAAVGTAGPAVHGVASGLLNWDAAHYLALAEHGYASTPDTNFFPLEPLLIHIVGEVMGFPNATIAVAWIAFAFAVWGIVDVATILTSSRRGAIAAALLFAWSPSVFFVTGYADSLLVALTVWSLRFCLQRRWLAAALLAGAASAVTPQGALAGVIVVVGILLAERGAKRVVLAAGYGLVSELGLIGFCLFCWSRFGNPVEFEKAGTTFWHDQITYPLHVTFRDLGFAGLTARSGPLITEVHFIYFLDVAAALVAIAAVVLAVGLCLRDRRWILPTLLLVMGAVLNLSVMDQWAAGEIRFIGCLVGVYLVSAVVFEYLARRSILLVAAVLVPSAALAIFVETLFHMAYWVV
jgi:hypothetical protein